MLGNCRKYDEWVPFRVMRLSRGQGQTPSRKLLVAFACVGASLVFGGGCSADDAPAGPGAGHALAEGCLINSDCASPLVCAFRRCHTQCKVARDCNAPERCVASDRPFNVCQQELEQPCTRNSDCPELQICANDQQCRDACQTDRDCVLGQVCVSRACAVPSELQGGQLPAPSNRSPDASAGVPCAYNSDCAEPLICSNGQCIAECTVDRDCAIGFVCQSERCAPRAFGGTGGASGGTGGAPPGSGGAGGQSPGSGGSSNAGTSNSGGTNAAGAGGSATGGRRSTGGAEGGLGCTYSSDCSSGQICRAGACIPECRVDRDCTPGEACQGGACVQVVPPGAPPGFGSACALNSDCPSGLICNAVGRCTWECTESRDCPLSYCCSAIHTCVTGSACQTTLPEAGTGTGDGGLGPKCLGDLDCQDTSVCNGFERCIAGHCAPPVKAACDDGNPCTQDGCSEATGKCTHSPSGPTDKDFDGHQPVACGGDDCDDSNGDVYTGATEKCDGLDNNCDGHVDEGTWLIGSSVSLPLGTGVSSNPGGSRYQDQNVGAPAMARLSNGNLVVAATDMDASSNLPSISAWLLDSSFKVLKGPVPVITNAPGAQYPLTAIPSVGTDGSNLVVGAFQFDVPNTCTWAWRARLAYGASIDGLSTRNLTSGTFTNWCSPWFNTMGATSPAFAYNGSRILLAFSDARDGSLRAYVDSMDSAGTLGGSKTVLLDATQSQDYGGGNNGINRVVMAAGTTTALVAWATNNPGAGTRPRYALLDANLGGVIAGPLDLTDTGASSFATSVAHVGHTFAIASQDGNGSVVNVRAVDDATGAQGGVTTIQGLPDPDARLVGIHGGFLVTHAAGKGSAFGWAPEDVSKGFSTRTSVGANTVSTMNTVIVDQTHAVVTWADGVVHVAPLTCGP